jgi:acyl-coenzyme A synthetase/AMP-(fatty) acid ligase
MAQTTEQSGKIGEMRTMPTSVQQAPELEIPFQSIRQVLRAHGTRHPDKTAIHDLDQDKPIGWGELHREANRVANWLVGRGVGKGDRVGLLSDESVEKLIIWMGIWRLGAVVCPLNVEMNEAHIRQLLLNIGPTITLWHGGVEGAAMTAGVSGEMVRFESWEKDAAGDADANELFAQLAAIAAEPEVAHENGPDDTACIFCTSGTTSTPKCVVYNHMAYWLNGLDTIDMLGLTGDDRTLEYRSFGWNSAQVLSLMPWIETGLSMHISKRFSHSRFFEWIKDHGITFAAGVPTVINMLLNEPLGITARDIPTLRLMTCSTAPLSPEQWRKFEEMYGVTLLQLYGMSEAGWICGNRHYRRRMGTVGPPARHQEFRIVDGDGNTCPPGVEGEVSIGGPQTCIGTISPDGVFNDERAQRIRSGDLAIMDDDGFVAVTGRTKDLIIRGGINIAPLEIDNVLMSHPKVREAAAIGVPDAIYGEAVVCYVVTKTGESLDAGQVIGHCSECLPDFKRPREVYFIDELPKSGRGKVMRDDLKELWAKDHGAG